MWMQILVGAGLLPIGEAFPAPWGEALKAANPRGFYESQLVAGIYYATNPHPETGAYLAPAATCEHVVKVFIPGLIRSDVAFLDRVIATVRPWRQYAASLARMKALADTDREAALFDVPLHPGLRWWAENFALIRDVATRGYPAHVTTYDRLLERPAAEVDAVLSWIGRGDRTGALAAIDRELRTELAAPEPAGVEPRHAAVFDELYDRIHRGQDLDERFVALLNRTDAELRPHLVAAEQQARESVVQGLAAAPSAP